MIILAWTVLTWKCAWWVPGALQLQPLLCKPELVQKVELVESQEAALKLAKDPAAAYTLILVAWDAEGKRSEEKRTLEWKPSIK